MDRIIFLHTKFMQNLLQSLYMLIWRGAEPADDALAFSPALAKKEVRATMVKDFFFAADYIKA